MLQKFSIDSMVTALACLSSSGNYNFNNVFINSKVPMKTDNYTLSCAHTLDISTRKLELLSEQLLNLQREVDSIKDLVKNFKDAPNLDPQSCENRKEEILGIKVKNQKDSFYVICDHEVQGGGWVVIARRSEGSVSFYRSWADYKTGFGNLNGDFFIGLEKLYAITNNQVQELLIILENTEKEERYAYYDQFSIGSEDEKYFIKILGKYSGNAGDALRYHAGYKFTTYDQDNDVYAQNCAKIHKGGWWYADCVESNLFGGFQQFGEPDIKNFQGIIWKGFKDGPEGSLKKIKMLVRPHRG